MLANALRFCRSFPRLHCSREERPRPMHLSQRQAGRHTDWTCAWKTTRADQAGQGPSHPGGWLAGRPSLPCYRYASGDDEMGGALSVDWWCRPRPCPSRGVPVPPMGHRAGGSRQVPSCPVLYRPLHQAGSARPGPRGRWATGHVSLLFITVENEACAGCLVRSCLLSTDVIADL